MDQPSDPPKVFDGYEEYWPKDRPYSPFEAWVDLVQMAKPRVNGMGRGQVLVSVRFLATRWKWDRNRVNRWLRRAEKSNGLARHSTSQAGTVYTIVNYDTYQSAPKAGETPHETQTETFSALAPTTLQEIRAPRRVRVNTIKRKEAPSALSELAPPR